MPTVANRPAMLTFKTDKDNYLPGEKLVITIPSAKGSRAVVSIENARRYCPSPNIPVTTNRP